MELQEYSSASMERTMKVQEVIMRAMAKQITWWQAAEILGVSTRTMRRMKRGWNKVGYAEQALWSRSKVEGVIHHSDRGSQYLSIRYSERLIDAGVKPSVGTTGDSYDNALAETIIGLYKTEVIHHRGPWRQVDAVEYATLEWVDWFNNRRLLEPIGDMPPAEFETAYYRQQEESAILV